MEKNKQFLNETVGIDLSQYSPAIREKLKLGEYGFCKHCRKPHLASYVACKDCRTSNCAECGVKFTYGMVKTKICGKCMRARKE